MHRIKYFIVFLLVSIVLGQKYCYSREKLILSRSKFPPTIIDTSQGSSVTLQCAACNSTDLIIHSVKKYWTKKIDLNNEIIKILSLKNSSSNTEINSIHELIIKNVQVEDSGFYFCRNRGYGDEDDNFVYFIDVLNEYKNITINATQWMDCKNQEMILNKDPLINKYFHIYTTWSDWSVCSHNIEGEKNERLRVGKCKIKLKDLYADMNKQNPYKNVQLFYDPYGLRLSCHSSVLIKHFPDLYTITQDLSRLIMTEECMYSCEENCVTVFQNEYVLFEEDNAEIDCAGFGLNANVSWHRVGRSSHLPSNKHVVVDILNTLHLLNVRVNEQGRYWCTVNGVKLQESNVIIKRLERVSSQELLFHIIYLSWVFILLMIVYFCILTITWRQQEIIRYVYRHKR